MKTLKEYINNINLDIKDSIELHFYAEFVLNESFKSSYFKINEKYGSYIGQKELIIDLAKEIWNTIQNKDPENKFTLYKDDLANYSSIFFNELEIQLNNKPTYYELNKSKYDKINKIFNKVSININYHDVQSYGDLCSILMHEMLHAYNNYQGYLSSFNNSLLNVLNKDSSYNKTINYGNPTIENICKRILNNIRQWEQNAYIGELSIELEKNKFDLSKFHNIHDAYKYALEIFKKSDTWFQYETLYNYLRSLNSNNSDKQEAFANTYNDINGTNLTFNRIYRKLGGLFEKILLKIETKVPKIFYNFYQNELNKINIKENNIYGRYNMSLINFTEYLNNYSLLESVKPENGLDWEIYINGQLNKDFTGWAKKWKKFPKIGQGWYAGGTVFKINNIDNNKVYVEIDS